MRARVSRLLDSIQLGYVELQWPDGSTTCHGSPCAEETLDGFGTSSNPVVVTLHNYDPITSLATNGAIGWAESYIEGNWSTNSLSGLFALFMNNEQCFPSAIHGSVFSKIANRMMHRLNRNTLAGSQRNISRHYDLGNDFYRLWLDDSMSYSSAWFDDSDQSLGQAQRSKMHKIIDAVGAQPGDKVLEIGCGWGAMADRLAAESRCDVTGISLSREQLDYAQRVNHDNRIGEGSTQFEFRDYRHIKDQYEHIVSVEMFEAVGREYWVDYFAKLQSTLRRGGSAVLQVITILEDRFDGYVNKPDFIQKYVFPGGMLPTRTVLNELAETHGFRVDQADFFGQSYATTLQLWRKRFESSLDQIREQGFDESFIRMWRYYLAYCETGFSIGSTDVGVWRLVKK